MQYFTPYLSTDLLKHLPNINGLSNLHMSQWHDTNLENNVSMVLDICQVIRQMKSECGLIKKNVPKAHLFFDNEMLHELAIEHRQDIKSLTMCDDIILSNKPDNRSIEFVAKSTASHMCSIGISARCSDTLSNQVLSLNSKKLLKLEKELQKLLLTISQEGYKKSANQKIQEKHLEKVDIITNLNFYLSI